MSLTSTGVRTRVIVGCAGMAVALCAPTRLAAQATISEVVYPGFGSGSSFGAEIAGLGDINADGHADLVTSAYDIGGGLVLILSGADGAVIRQWSGDELYDNFGQALDCAGDVDGDGLLDVIVGAPFHDGAGTSAGVVRVFSSATGALLHEIPGLAAGDKFGQAVAGLGDVDGDGRGDYAASAPSASSAGASHAGYVRVFSGADGRELARIEGETDGQMLGSTVPPAGDFDADGTPDLVLVAGSLLESVPRHAIVYSGAWIAARTMPAVLLDYADDALERAVDGAGDLDHDGWDDLLVGMPFTPSYEGGWRAISGRDHSVLLSWTGDVPDMKEGSGVAGVGDIDGDGTDDVLVGNGWTASPYRHALLFSGADASILYTCESPWPNYGFGVGLAAVGDVNADDFPDWAVGGPAGPWEDIGGIVLYSPVGLWEDLGQGLAGSTGVPALSGSGLLLGGDVANVTLTGALPTQPFVLVIGLTTVNHPFHGGTFVPDADLLLFGVTDGSGSREWSSRWPSELSAQSFYFQAWMKDDQAVEGWAASNALRAQSP